MKLTEESGEELWNKIQEYAETFARFYYGTDLVVSIVEKYDAEDEMIAAKNSLKKDIAKYTGYLVND